MDATSTELIVAAGRTSAFFPALNASLNFLAAILLVTGYVLVRQKRLIAHERVMLAAFGVSAVFLASYLYYHFNYDSGRFPGQGLARTFYFTILISHVILATAMVPFILWMLWEALKGRFLKHARIARYVWPVWMYTSVTGVLVYVMLYHWRPGT